MELGRYVAARGRVEKLIADLNLPDESIAAQQLPVEDDILSQRLEQTTKDAGVAGAGLEGGPFATSSGTMYEMSPEEQYEDYLEQEQTHDAEVRKRIRKLLKSSGLTAVLSPEHESLLSQLQREERVYGAAQVPVADRPQYPRLADEEGIYVAPRPEIPDFNMFKIDSRLLREDPRMRVFYDHDGMLKIAPDLLGDPFTRPTDLADPFAAPDPRTLLCVAPPQKDYGGRRWRAMHVQATTLTVMDHELFTPEDYWCVQLQGDFEAWRRMQIVDLVRYHEGHIAAAKMRLTAECTQLEMLRARLRATAEAAVDPALRAETVAMAVRVLDTMSTLRKARVSRDEEWNKRQRLLATMLDTWNKISQWRKKMGSVFGAAGLFGGPVGSSSSSSSNSQQDGAGSGSGGPASPSGNIYVGYPLALRFVREPVDAEAEANAWRQDEVEELEEAKEFRSVMNLVEDLQLDPMRPKKTVTTVRRRKRTTPNSTQNQQQQYDSSSSQNPADTSADSKRPEGNEGEDGEEEEELVEEVVEDEEDIARRERQTFRADAELARIRERMCASRRAPGAPKYDPVLEDGVAVTPMAACSAQEQRRRQRIGSQGLYVELVVNGKLVTQTKPVLLEYPGWRATFPLSVTLQLITPPSVSLRLRRAGYFGSDLLAEVPVKVPQPGAAPLQQEPRFSGLRIDVGSFPEAPSIPTYRRVSGALELAVFWDKHVGNDDDWTLGDTATGGARRGSVPMMTTALPGTASGASAGAGAGAGAGVGAGAGADPNDSRAQVLAELDRRRVDQTDNTFTGSDLADSLVLINEAYYVPSSRKRLLAARNRSLAMHTPIPIAEDDISAELFAMFQLSPTAPPGSLDDPFDLSAGLPASHALTAALPGYSAAARATHMHRPGMLGAGGARSHDQVQHSLPYLAPVLPNGMVSSSDHLNRRFRRSSLMGFASTPEALVDAQGQQEMWRQRRSNPSNMPLTMEEARLQAIQQQQLHNHGHGPAPGSGSGADAPFAFAQMSPTSPQPGQPGWVPPDQYVFSAEELASQRRQHEALLADPAAENRLRSAGAGLAADMARDPIDLEALAQNRDSAQQTRALEIHDVSQVVRELVNPDFIPTGDFLKRLFRPPRPLYVYRDETEPVANPKACALVVQVVRASNLPLRASSTPLITLASAIERKASEPDPSSLNCVVQVSFQDVTRRTSASAGSNPSWNEVLILPFTSPTDAYDPAGLLSILAPIRITVYDQVSVPLPAEDQRLRRTEVRTTDLRFLGQLELPFTTLYRNTKIQGGFELTMPLIHLGYTSASPDTPPPMIHIFVRLDPTLLPPPEEPLPSPDELSPALAMCANWARAIKEKSQCKHRIIRPIVGDINAMPQLVCRYLLPQAPPKDVSYHPRAFTRFVSQIPFVEDFQLGFTNKAVVSDVWCTSSQFLRLGHGDWEEHAILLANFYLWWDEQNIQQYNLSETAWDTYLLLGNAVPTGEVVWVLRLGWHKGVLRDEIFIDPKTGTQYVLPRDAARLPLTSIGCLVGRYNVWANVQERENPAELFYNTERIDAWTSMFSRRFPITEFARLSGHHYTSLQRSLALAYEPNLRVTRSDVEAVWKGRSADLEAMIMRAVEDWRTLPTTWSYGAALLMRQMAQQFESAAERLAESAESKADEQLIDRSYIARLRATYPTMHGFPLHFTCGIDDKSWQEPSSTNPILRRLRSTLLHLTEEPDAAFAVAVVSHGYTTRFASVWVYYAMVSRAQ